MRLLFINALVDVIPSLTLSQSAAIFDAISIMADENIFEEFNKRKRELEGVENAEIN